MSPEEKRRFLQKRIDFGALQPKRFCFSNFKEKAFSFNKNGLFRQ